MAEPVAELHLSDYLDIARRRKWVIAAIAALALFAAITLSALQTPLYRAEARVRVETQTASSILDDSTNLSSSVRFRNLQNEVEFAKSDRVRETASGNYGAPIGASISPSDSSDTLIFRVTNADPDAAAGIANTFADAYVEERSEAASERYLNASSIINDRLAEISGERLALERQLDTTTDRASIAIQITTLDDEESRLRAQLNEIDVLSQVTQNASVAILNAATPPGSPFSPSWTRNLALALIAGLILGVGAALLFETLDDTVVSKRDLERSIDGTPVLGVIPPPWRKRRQRKDRRLVSGRTGAFTESFRALRSAIELGQATGGEIRSILVTSASPSEGKSTVAAHLAVSFARAGNNVLVIDADMHNPTQHVIFGVKNINGLAEHLSDLGQAETLHEQASGESLVSIIPAGTSSLPPAELLSSASAQEFIDKLSYAYDLVIVDSPPLRPVADTLPLARITDATLLVAMRGRTSSRELEQAMEQLARAQIRPLGAVLNGVDEDEGGYGYGYGYGAKRR